MKISEAFDAYRSQMMVRNMGKRILEQYACTKRYLLEILGDMDIADLTIDDVLKWVEELRKTRQNNTVAEYICRLRMVLRYCYAIGEKCLNYELIPVPKRDPVIVSYLTSEEVSRMVENACNIRAKFVVSLFFASGIRVSELISLNRGQIHNGQFTVVGKGKKVRLCFTDGRTDQLMRQYLRTRKDNCDALIATRQGSRMTPTNVQLIVRNAAIAAGVAYKHVHPHTLRHSFATDYIHNGGNIRYLAPMLGHANISTTARYTHYEDADLKRQHMLHHST